MLANANDIRVPSSNGDTRTEDAINIVASGENMNSLFNLDNNEEEVPAALMTLRWKESGSIHYLDLYFSGDCF